MAMAKISRNFGVLVCLISCVFIAAGPLVGPTAEAQARKVELIQDSYKNSTILVEAFVVEVRLSALYDSGVSPIGERPNSVSIEKILSCLQDKDNTQVSTGAKVAVQQRQRGTTESEETIYVERQEPIKTNEKNNKPVVSRAFQPYKIGKSFEASANILAHNKIFVSYDFREDAAEKVSLKNGVPPNIVKRLWAGTVCLERGKASIVGATQDEQKAVFLILCADIRDS